MNRDTSNLNGAVSKTPDVQNLLNQQADLMDAAGADGQVVSQEIGAYADMKRDTAIVNAQAAEARGDTQATQGYWSDAQSWTDDGSNRLALHIAGRYAWQPSERRNRASEFVRFVQLVNSRR